MPSTWWWSLNYKYSLQAATGRRVCKTQAWDALAFQVQVIKLICRKCRGSILMFQSYALYQLKVEKKEKHKNILLYTPVSLTEL